MLLIRIRKKVVVSSKHYKSLNAVFSTMDNFISKYLVALLGFRIKINTLKVIDDNSIES
jgi:hypothetical protein